MDLQKWSYWVGVEERDVQIAAPCGIGSSQTLLLDGGSCNGVWCQRDRNTCFASILEERIRICSASSVSVAYTGLEGIGILRSLLG